MKLKLDANGNVVLQDGRPVYIKDDGSEVAFDVVGTVNTIARLNNEAKTHREGKEAAEQRLAAFADIDPAAAKKALDLAKNLDDKKLVDAGKVEEVKAEVNKSWQTKYDALQQQHTQVVQERDGERMSNLFNGSTFIKKKTTGPDIVQALFGKNVKFENGRPVVLDANGQKIYSPSNPGELASFEEGIGVLVNAYPNKTAILLSDAVGGGGTTPGGGERPGGGGGATVTRTAFGAMSPAAQAAHVKAGGKVTDAPAA